MGPPFDTPFAHGMPRKVKKRRCVVTILPVKCLRMRPGDGLAMSMSLAQVSWTLSLSLSRPALAQLTLAPKVDNQPGDFNIDNSGPTKVSGG